MRFILISFIFATLSHAALADEARCSFKVAYEADQKSSFNSFEAFKNRAHFSCPGKWKGEAETKVSCGDAKSPSGQTTVELKDKKLEVLFAGSSTQETCLSLAKKDCEMASSSSEKSLKKVVTVSISGQALNQFTCDTKGKVAKKDLEVESTPQGSAAHKSSKDKSKGAQ